MLPSQSQDILSALEPLLAGSTENAGVRDTNVGDDLAISRFLLCLPADPVAARSATPKRITKTLGLSSEQELEGLLQSLPVQIIFSRYSETYLRTHPRAPPPQPRSIQGLLLSSMSCSDREAFYDGLVDDFPDHADSRGAEFVWRMLQFLTSQECSAMVSSKIPDLSKWEVRDACRLCIAILTLLQREWQDNYLQSRAKEDAN